MGSQAIALPYHIKSVTILRPPRLLLDYLALHKTGGILNFDPTIQSGGTNGEYLDVRSGNGNENENENEDKSVHEDCSGDVARPELQDRPFDPERRRKCS